MTSSRLPVGIPDRVPPLADLIRASDLGRTLQPFVAGSIGGVALFARDGTLFAGAHAHEGPMASWEQLPPEAAASVQRGASTSFGIADSVFDVRAVYAGTDRVGVLLVARAANPTDADEARDASVADALNGVVAMLLQAGYATWVTSEMHLATSQSAHAALTQRNSELERAVAHLRELDKLKSNFLATVSHELRTPLTSVIGFSEMLLEGLAGALNEEQSEYVKTILNRGEELLTLISHVLEMSQLEVGTLRLDLEANSLAAILARAAETLRPVAEAASVRIDAQIDADTAAVPHVLVDAEKIQRVLQNLIGNAIKFSKPGGYVSISAAPAPIRKPFREETLFGEEADDAVRVTVTDRGIGIEAEELPKIFEAFYQVDASPTREHGGAGLGLSIVKNLVQAHGGDVWAESKPGTGTSIHFTVPIATSKPR
ncbi:MAG: sensor histidine kinase [Nannocystaceae bacterium]|nr:HAMP domain-containing histidine kinase [bacterium]